MKSETEEQQLLRFHTADTLVNTTHRWAEQQMDVRQGSARVVPQVHPCARWRFLEG